jgi:choline monooxygenase
MSPNGEKSHDFAPACDPGAQHYTREETYRQTRLPVQLASTLIPDAYRSPQLYAVEQERVFSRGWVCAGYTSQVAEPGDVLVASVAGQPLLVSRDHAGQLRAFYNVCRHRGSLLVAADGKHSVIRCPYHSWGYALDGRLLGAPYFKGLDVPPAQQALFDTTEAKGFCKEDYGLLSVAVAAWGCFVFVNLDPEPRPLAEWLGDLPRRFARYPLHELRLVRRRAFDIRANWKLVAENFMEYYHLPWVHPELCNISGFSDHHRFQGPGLYTGLCTSPLSRDPDTVRFELPVMPGLNAVEAQSAYWILLFPNIALFLFPDHLFTLLLQPDGPGRTLESADMLVHRSALDAPDADRQIDHVAGFWGMVNEQDVAAVERVQRGLQTRAYPGGRMCYRFEEPIHRFQNMVIDRMTGVWRVPPGDEREEAPPTPAAAGRE